MERGKVGRREWEWLGWNEGVMEGGRYARKERGRLGRRERVKGGGNE